MAPGFADCRSGKDQSEFPAPRSTLEAMDWCTRITSLVYEPSVCAFHVLKKNSKLQLLNLSRASPETIDAAKAMLPVGAFCTAPPDYCQLDRKTVVIATYIGFEAS